MGLLSDGHHENFVGQHGLQYSLTKDDCICTAGYRNVRKCCCNRGLQYMSILQKMSKSVNSILDFRLSP